jgi:hypothetical protein
MKAKNNNIQPTPLDIFEEKTQLNIEKIALETIKTHYFLFTDA